MSREPPHRWPAEATPISDELEHDGTVCHRTEAHPALGYRLWGPSYGSHLLSPDGERLRVDPEATPPGAWQRLLIAQVLPFAALLHGLEVFHASAVVVQSGAVGLLGPSGSGKTTLAFELCQRGAVFLADDVLVVEPHGGSLLAHPGAPVLGLDHGEARRRAGLGTSLDRMQIDANERERLLRVGRIGGPAPIAALFLLDRRPDGPAEPTFDAAVQPRTLLAATFNFVLDAPDRLLRLLEACALLAEGRVERVLAGPRVSPAQLARAITSRLERN
ncbi:MAG TPA: hypothetical protein VGF47_06425 [Solirubrobacteraceae bacterium]